MIVLTAKPHHSFSGVEFVVVVVWITASGAMERVNIENPWASTSLSRENEVRLVCYDVKMRSALYATMCSAVGTSCGDIVSYSEHFVRCF
jgi:hypothetical protein